MVSHVLGMGDDDSELGAVKTPTKRPMCMCMMSFHFNGEEKREYTRQHARRDFFSVCNCAHVVRKLATTVRDFVASRPLSIALIVSGEGGAVSHPPSCC